MGIQKKDLIWLGKSTAKAILALLVVGCLLLVLQYKSTACSRDKDRYLFFETLSLIDSYYIEMVDKQNLIVDAFRGIMYKLPLEKTGLKRVGNIVELFCDNSTQTITLGTGKNELVQNFFTGYQYFGNHCTGPDADRKFLYAAVSNMVGTLDPHSAFLEPKSYSRLQEETKGTFGGIGIEIGLRNGKLTVVAAIEDTPAWHAGLKARDSIEKIDGKETKGLDLMEAVNMIRGEIGTSVVLSIRRGANLSPFDVTIVRQKIVAPSVKWEIISGNIGWLKLLSFSSMTSDDLDDALIKMEKKGIRVLVLDIRNNPGGLLDQAVSAANKFISHGLIVSTLGRGMIQDRERFAVGKNAHDKIPIICLINGGSASGAEILAGALQDHNRAVLIGSRSFGKGSVQSIFKLPNNAGLRLTTARYYTPSGRSIQAEGIIPDVRFTFPEENEDMEESNYFLGERSLPNHIQGKGSVNSIEAISIDAKLAFVHFLRQNKVQIDEEEPERADMLKPFVLELAASKNLTKQALIERSKEMIEQIKETTSEPTEKELALMTTKRDTKVGPKSEDKEQPENQPAKE